MAKRTRLYDKRPIEVGKLRRYMIAFLREQGVEFPAPPKNGVLVSMVRARLDGLACVNISTPEGLRVFREKLFAMPLAGKLRKSAPRKPANDGFYQSKEWQKIRYRALLKNDGKCELCGCGKHDGVKLHVDHIKPRSKYPEMELQLTNLQVLCEPCNMGKSNKDDTDWRG